MNRISLNTVAREAGVSKTTASLVLNNKGDRYHIAKATAQRVINVSKRLGYHPNKIILNSFRGQSMVIGLLAPHFNTSESGEWLEFVIQEARTLNYQIITDTYQPNHGDLSRLIKDFSDYGVDGLIVLTPSTQQPVTVASLETKLPLIFAGQQPGNNEGLWVTDDFAGGINLLIDYLYRHNKRAIGYLGARPISPGQAEKRNTYLENYCQRFDIPPNIELLEQDNLNSESITQACFKLMERGANGLLFGEAGLALTAFSDPKFRDALGEDIFCASYGFHPSFQLISKGLIHSRSNTKQMAAQAIGMLIKTIQNEPIHSNSVKVLPYL